jgi:nitrate reductase gamma subunit
MTTLGKILIVAAYCVYAAFWIRFFAHALVWWRAARRLSASAPAPVVPRPRVKVFALTAADVFLFGRLLVVNPALWLGEWVFHVSLLLVLLRHLRYFLDPVPAWVWSIQFAGTIAGYVLLLSLVYIFFIRLFTAMEKYASRANMFLLGLVLVITSIGVIMHAWLTPNLLDVKLFARGFLCLNPTPAPESLLFMTHFILVLVLVPFLPTHIFTAPLVMMEARKREQALHLVMHEE